MLKEKQSAPKHENYCQGNKVRLKDFSDTPYASSQGAEIVTLRSTNFNITKPRDYHPITEKGKLLRH